MPVYSLLAPLDQPLGRRRLLQGLADALKDDSFTQARWAVAFAKSGPLIRLDEDLIAWRDKGKSIEAVIGLDHQGTSLQALDLALRRFNATYVLSPGGFSTFHPKLYLFYGDRRALAFVGSHNLTVGGTETNFECGIQIELDLPTDEALLIDLRRSWEELITGSNAKLLTEELLRKLAGAGALLDEFSRGTSARHGDSRSTEREGTIREVFGSFGAVPPSAIPSSRLTRGPVMRGRRVAASLAPSVPVQSLVIEIVPHHNGEVFLSKTAVNQNPGFFGFPFTGHTFPKRSGNKPYPQRQPDPLVSVSIYDASGHRIRYLPSFGLNMVFYETKSEIRITFSQAWLGDVASGSIMVMRVADASSGLDYELEIFAPGGLQHGQYLAACNQVLPSGGGTPRRMGWI